MTTDAHPPLAELAEQIAVHGLPAHPPLRGNVVHHAVTLLAPLYAELERLKAENARLLNDLAMLRQTDLLQAALIRKDALLRECRGYVNEAVAAEYFAREAEYESHASEWRAEASVHRGLLSRIDREIGGGDERSSD